MKKQSFSVLIFLSLLLLLQMGCTVIGFTAGALSDARQPKQEKTIQTQEVVELKKNALITVFYKDSTQVTGLYREVIHIRSSKDSTSAGILLEKKGGQFEQYRIPFEQIDHIYVPARKSKGKIIGLAVGVAVDLSVIFISFSLEDCC